MRPRGRFVQKLTSLFQGRRLLNFSTGLPRASAVTALFICIYLFGYSAHFANVGLNSDDLYTFSKVSNGDAWNYINQALFGWVQGRPLGHGVYRILQWAFHSTPTGWFQFLCLLLIAIQSYLAFEALKRLGIAAFGAFIAATIIGFAPFYQSVYLPIHAALIEFGTILFLGALLLAFKEKPISAAMLAAISSLIYEHMLPLFFLPALILFTARFRQTEFRDAIKIPNLVSASRPPVTYGVAFTLLILGIFKLRSILSYGREQELADFTARQLAARMYNAANTGAQSTIEAFSPNVLAPLMQDGQNMILIIFGVMLLCYFIYWRAARENPDVRAFQTRSVIFLAATGVAIIWVSHLIYITPERYPPTAIYGRMSNTHSSARLGYILIFAVVLHQVLSVNRSIVRNSAVALSLFFVAILAAYSNGYGAGQAKNWEKRIMLAKAHYLACHAHPKLSTSILLLPEGYAEQRANSLIDWATYKLPQVFFSNGERQSFFAVREDNSQAFLETLKTDESLDLTDYVEGSYFVRLHMPTMLNVQKSEIAVTRLTTDNTIDIIHAPASTQNMDASKCSLSPHRKFQRKFTELSDQ